MKRIGERLARMGFYPVIFAVVAVLPAQASGVPKAVGGAEFPAGPMDDISNDMRDRIWVGIDKGRATMRAQSAPRSLPAVTFGWPLRASRGHSSPGFHWISNFVDHDASFPGNVRDYQCGARSYDRSNGYNHKGTDIALSPDSWNLMATGQIEIVAAAAGTIVFRQDGNFDQNCQFNNSDWNAVYVQHADGSIAWYGHMKQGSVTAKTIGERVAAGEYLGRVGSSGNSTGPHLHFEVYDSERRLIDPWHGQCNRLTDASWWTDQKPYHDSTLNKLMTLSSPPVIRTCGADGKLADPGNYYERTAFAPGDTAYFFAVYRDQLDTQTTDYRIYRPDGSIWKQWSHRSDQPHYPSSFWYWPYALDSNALPGTWVFEAVYNGKTTTTSFAVNNTATPIVNYSSLWWRPSESGWGVNVNHQGDILFATWFTYDADGSGLWLVMPNAGLQSDGSYRGEIYRTTGTPLAQINGVPSSSNAATVGSGMFRFTSPSNGTFSYSVLGVDQQKAIERQVFGALPNCTVTRGSRASLTNYQDLWWTPAESGWGINLTHQGDNIFSTWFTYRADGKGQWLVASNVARQLTGEFTGRLYRTVGTPFNFINGRPAVDSGVTDVGEITFDFSNGETAQMSYTVDGVTQAKKIVRQTFAELVPRCQ